MLGQPDSGVLFTDPRAGGRGPGGCREPSRSAGSRNVDSWRHGPTAIGSLFPIHTAGCSRGGGLADVLANTSGHIAASTGASPMNMNVSPNATPAPTVNHATFVAALRPRRRVMLFVEAAYCRHRNGTLSGYEAVAVYLPEKQLTLVILTNTDIHYRGADPSTTLAAAITTFMSTAWSASSAQPTSPATNRPSATLASSSQLSPDAVTAGPQAQGGGAEGGGVGSIASLRLRE